VHVHDGHRQHKGERGQDEHQRGGERAERSVAKVTDPHDDLGGERPWHRLAERHAAQEVLPIQPAAPLDQIALHVADCGDRTPEAPDP
jgi:hypothetical protein